MPSSEPSSLSPPLAVPAVIRAAAVTSKRPPGSHAAAAPGDGVGAPRLRGFGVRHRGVGDVGGDRPPSRLGTVWGRTPAPQMLCPTLGEVLGGTQGSGGAVGPEQWAGMLRGAAPLGKGLIGHCWVGASLCRGCGDPLPGVAQHPSTHPRPGSGRNFPFPNRGWGKACACTSPLLSLPSPVTAREGACHIQLREGAEPKKPPGKETGSREQAGAHPQCSDAAAPLLLPRRRGPGRGTGRLPARHPHPRAALHGHPAPVPPAPPALEPGLPGLRRAAGHRGHRPPAPPALAPRAHAGTPGPGAPAALPGRHPLQPQPGALPAAHQARPLLGGAVAGAGAGGPLAGARAAGRAGGRAAPLARAPGQLLALPAAPPLRAHHAELLPPPGPPD